MAHDTHHDTHAHTDVNAKPNTSSRSAMWFVLILAGLFIAAVNFVGVMGHDEEVGHYNTHEDGLHDNKEATVNQSLHGETGIGKDAEHTTQHHGTNAATDSAHMEGHESH